MEPIFAQLSLEYLMAGKTLPWNKRRDTPMPNFLLTRDGNLYMVQANTANARSYFSL